MKLDEEVEFEVIYKDDFKMDVISEAEIELIREYLPDILRDIMNKLPLEGGR